MSYFPNLIDESISNSNYNISNSFKKYFEYVFSKSYSDQIDYKYLLNIFWDCMNCNNYSYDYKWNN